MNSRQHPKPISALWATLFTVLLLTVGGLASPKAAVAEPPAAPDRQVQKCYEEGRILYCEPDTLQALINQAGTTPTRIEIGNGTETLVTKTLVIPAGADIELVDTNIVQWSSDTKIVREDGEFTGSLIHVEKGGKLTLSDGTGNGEGIIIDSRAQYENVVKGSSFSPTILVEGELVMNAGTVTGARKMSSVGEGAVTVTGTDAKFTLNNGTITDNQRKEGAQFGAANVALTNGATMVMNGGEISKGVCNYSPYAYGEAGGIGVFSGAHLTINGGTLTENTGWAGNINVSNWLMNESSIKPGDDTSSTRSTLEFNDGTISNGKAAFAGGGISIFGNADVTMNGGTIDGNIAANGGGVNAMDIFVGGAADTWQEIDSDGARWTKQHFGERRPEEWTKISPARFTMNGGSITNNSASRTGGGVNVISNAVHLNAGLIEGNNAHDQGGGVYVATKSYTANFMDTLITDNKVAPGNFAAFGGGIWLCPTGSLITHVTNGVAVFDNQSPRVSSVPHWGDDIAHDNYGSANRAGLRIDPRMLGGGEPNYYKDGSQSSNGSRFDPANPGKRQVFDGTVRESDDNADYRDAIMNEGLKTIVDPEAKEAAKSWAKLIIQKNSAPRGAGVGSNGRLSFGTPGTTQVKVTKAWKDTAGKDLAEDKKVPVKVQLVGTVGDAKFYIGEPAELKADNNWTHVFTDLPKTKTVDGEQVEIQYFIEEQGIAGFVMSVRGNAKDGFTIVNTHIPPPVTTTVTTTTTPPAVTTTVTPPPVTTTTTPPAVTTTETTTTTPPAVTTTPPAVTTTTTPPAVTTTQTTTETTTTTPPAVTTTPPVVTTTTTPPAVTTTQTTTETTTTTPPAVTTTPPAVTTTATPPTVITTTTPPAVTTTKTTTATTTTTPPTTSTTSTTTVTSPVVTTTKTTTATPPTVTTTATPPTVTTTATPDNPRPTLARTGANVGATVALALALIGLGLVLIRRKRS